jgi:hypothetical protein
VSPELPDHLDEQFPLAPLDDHLIHQTPDPVRVVWTTDPRAYERHWAVFHDEVGDLLVATGGSIYPNLGTAEAWAIVVHRGIHRSVRAFRPLGVDRMDLHVGPVRPTIVSGLREWRHELAENDQGITYDLRWEDRKRSVYNAAHGSLVAGGGAQRHVTAGFEGFGVVEGWVQIDGERIELPAGTMRGTRDRHWGIGRGVGGPKYQPSGVAPRAGWKGGNWIWADDFAVWGRTVLYDFGDPQKGLGSVRSIQRRLRFEEGTRIFVAGEIDYRFSDGRTRSIRLERLGNQTAYMRCALYGGSPDGSIHQGDDVGVHVEGDTFDVTDPEVRARLSGLNEHHCRVTTDSGHVTTGILQPLEPDAYEACAAGEDGWAFLD